MVGGLGSRGGSSFLLRPRSSSTTGVACFLRVLLVFLHLSCVPDDCWQDVAANVVVLGSGMFRRSLVGFAGDDALRFGWLRSSSYLALCSRRLPECLRYRNKLWKSFLHSTGAGSAASCDRSWCTCATDHGEIGGDSACAFHRGAVVAFRATDYGENVDAIQLVHLHCGAARGRANATDHEDLRC